MIGPQGAGKGTQAGLLARRFRIPHISSGDELRREIAAKTALGKRISGIIHAGALLPDTLLMKVILKRLGAADCRRGWILDGSPRTVWQARTLAQFQQPNIIVHLELSDKDAIRRLSGRRVCPHGHIYHLRHDPPKKRRGFCDRDGLKLHVRDDDTAQAIRRRLRIYHRQTAPVIRWYQGRVPITHIDSRPKISVVYQSILKHFRRYPWLSLPAKRR